MHSVIMFFYLCIVVVLYTPKRFFGLIYSVDKTKKLTQEKRAR